MRMLIMWLGRGAWTWFVYMPPGSSLYVGHQGLVGRICLYVDWRQCADVINLHVIRI